MLLNDEDKSLIKNIVFKECGLRRILAKYLEKNSKREGLDTLLKKMRETVITN